ncbi:hypothetical protein [Burkholderia pseudomallei]|nr:hypothetical protein [Burkholderia pseudomallei]VBV79671.1 Uncharacterised protein [Burkholderia pseudomallei]
MEILPGRKRIGPATGGRRADQREVACAGWPLLRRNVELCRDPALS